ERHGAAEIQLLEDRRAERPRAEVALRERHLDRVLERGERVGAPVRERGLEAGLERGEGGGVRARRREAEVHELEERLEVLGRGAAGQALLELAHERAD